MKHVSRTNITRVASTNKIRDVHDDCARSECVERLYMRFITYWFNSGGGRGCRFNNTRSLPHRCGSSEVDLYVELDGVVSVQLLRLLICVTPLIAAYASLHNRSCALYVVPRYT